MDMNVFERVYERGTLICKIEDLPKTVFGSGGYLAFVFHLDNEPLYISTERETGYDLKSMCCRSGNTKEAAMVAQGYSHVLGKIALTGDEAQKMLTAMDNARNSEKARHDEAVPGLEILREAWEALRNDAGAVALQWREMMSEDNDGANLPSGVNSALGQNYVALAAQYPRATLYLKAEHQADTGHWADNAGKMAAGKKACEILAAGGSLEEAKKALLIRREYYN